MITRAYIDTLPRWQHDICQEVRELSHAADPEVAETIKRTVQPYLVLRGEHRRRARREGPRERLSVRRRHLPVSFRDGEAINKSALTAMFRQIVANNGAGGWRKVKGNNSLRRGGRPGAEWRTS